MKRYVYLLILCVLVVFSLFAPGVALDCAAGGLLLWYQKLLPVLFPFMIFSNLLLQLDGIALLLRLLQPLLHILFGTTIHGSYAILAGFFFGCPMGAKIVADLSRNQLISPEEAEYLIGFVNNLSPAFLSTFLIRESLQCSELTLPILSILYGTPLLYGLISRFFYRSALTASPEYKNKASKVPNLPELLDACIFDGIVCITRLGAYLMLFAMLAGVLGLLPLQNTLLQLVLQGCTEITAGIRQIAETPMPQSLKLLILMPLCSFGGLCTLLQTFSVCPMSPAMRRHYLSAKLTTVGICCLLTLLWLNMF